MSQGVECYSCLPKTAWPPTCLLSKTEQDSREDFKGVYDFAQAFRQPFLPKNRPSASNSEKRVSKPTQT